MPSRLKSLRDQKAFPKFKDLPAASFFHPAYHEPCVQEKHGYEAKRHWCFLAEIDGITEGDPLVLGVTDKDHGTSIPVAFPMNEFCTEWVGDVAIGKAILIMYAEQHSFEQGVVGLDVNETRAIKVRAPPTLTGTS